MGHEMVIAQTMSHLLRVAKAAEVLIVIDAIVAKMARDVEDGARDIDEFDPLGAVGIRAVGAAALRLIGPAIKDSGGSTIFSDVRHG